MSVGGLSVNAPMMKSDDEVNVQGRCKVSQRGAM